MGKNKLQRFADNASFENVFQPTRNELLDHFALQGNWNKKYFNNNHPIVLELGCGRGEYTVALAEKFPEKNFIGIDIKGARFWVGAKHSLAKGLKNVGFLRIQIQDILSAFEANEISEIWITFPDPQIRFKRASLRLTHPDFLLKYHQILQPEGILHLKTDSEFLHGYTQGVLWAQNHKIRISQHDVYGAKADNIPEYVTDTQTHYEKLFLEQGKKITYLQFQLNY